MGLGRTWTKDEETYMQENWGLKSIPTIAKQLGRTENAIKVRAFRMSLGPVLMGGDYVTLNQLLNATGNQHGGGYKIKSWVEKRGLPVHYKRVDKNSFRVVYLDEFWKWAEKNRSFLDFSKFPPMALGAEPAWVKDQRRKDSQSIAMQRKDPWTPGEDAMLLSLLREQRYGYQELSRMLRRTCGAIQRRCCDLGTKMRPVRASAHEGWTEQDYALLADGIRNGESYGLIGDKIGKSDKAIRGKVYQVYLTENADKIRAMMGKGSFGQGAPEPNIRQSMSLTGRKKEALAAIDALVGVLQYRRNTLAGWDAYFQRHMCMHWDDGKGCTAGQTECDSCVCFERIRPQYCCRCGQSFLERVKGTFCPACREARKKKAQRKYQRERSLKSENIGH